MKKNIIFTALVAVVATLSTLGIYQYFQAPEGRTVRIEHIDATPGKAAVLTYDNDGNVVPLDFTKTAEKVVKAVVHIKATQTFANRGGGQMPQNFQQLPDPFRDFFGDRGNPFGFQMPQGQQGPQRHGPQLRVGTGSGVIINEKGYIVTNNHVVADADDLEVTLSDNRAYKATVVGTDPSTDLALIQIKAKNLPTLPLVNSDDIKVGEWVLAVGNPLGLTSTVTAGIVSAKGRNINILKEQFAVESFIQTDAAINPGNSGGALVNLQGGLVGINSAIASPTGSYAGYGFAVPSNIVNKVVQDLLTYGVVQRGVLGVMIRSVNDGLSKDKDLDVVEGAYVDSLLENSAAASAGILPGDVITEVDGITIKTSPDLQAAIAQHSPGDVVEVKVDRGGKMKTFSVTLNNRAGGRNLVEKEHQEVLAVLGADFENVDGKLAKKLDIPGGVKVTKLYAGKLRKYTDMREGFIITQADGQKVKNVDDLVKALDGKKGGVMLEGVYEDIPGTYFYAFGMGI
ncbi:MAG TPA: Do family serine endopeptidase [Bacteroidetes bacterium]|nr:Do family serine endopeptidase [Bacteroidota bacterium]